MQASLAPGRNGCRGESSDIGEWGNGGIRADASARKVGGGGGSCRYLIEHGLLGSEEVR
jgi:hypothetical protein